MGEEVLHSGQLAPHIWLLFTILMVMFKDKVYKQLCGSVTQVE